MNLYFQKELTLLYPPNLSSVYQLSKNILTALNLIINQKTIITRKIDKKFYLLLIRYISKAEIWE